MTRKIPVTNIKTAMAPRMIPRISVSDIPEGFGCVAKGSSVYETRAKTPNRLDPDGVS
jgi:hypothetical protein